MDKLLRVAEVLDKSGHYSLSDQFLKVSQNMPKNLSNTVVMDGSQYFDNPYTPKDILKLRNMIVPTNFRNQFKRFHDSDTELNSSDPTSFATSLFEFARRNNLNGSLVKAFDAYADIGATYNGKRIKNIPQLKELYMYIRNNNRMFRETEVAELLKKSFSEYIFQE